MCIYVIDVIYMCIYVIDVIYMCMYMYMCMYIIIVNCASSYREKSKPIGSEPPTPTRTPDNQFGKCDIDSFSL